VEGFRDSLKHLLDFEGRVRLQCPISHRIAEGLELNFANEAGEDGVAAAGVVVAEHGVGRSGLHVGNENAKSCRAVRCCSGLKGAECGQMLSGAMLQWAESCGMRKDVVWYSACSEVGVQMKAEKC
jgi:hypothetical protein